MNDHQDCQHLLGSLSDFLDGDLQADLCAQIERHLAECPNCKIVVDTLQKTVSLYQTVSEQEPVPDGVRQRLFRRLQIDDLLDKGL
jgi:anti-sigma factor (TIGR02949 family)